MSLSATPQGSTQAGIEHVQRRSTCSSRNNHLPRDRPSPIMARPSSLEFPMSRAQCRAAIVCLTLGMSCVKGYAQTQTQTSLVDLMLNTFDKNVALATTPGGTGVVAHTAVFTED